MFKQLFLIKPVKWEKYLKKNIFNLKVRHIQLNYAFLLFCSIFGEIHREFLFFVQKWLSQKRVLKNSESLFFWTFLKRGKSWGNLDLFKQLFLIKPVKGDNINKNCFSPKSEPHTTKLCFSVVLNHFGGSHRELLILVKKVAISERSTEKPGNFFFLNMFEKGQILRKIWISLNNCF